MKLSFRPADPNDAAALIELYDRHYRGGYSACFDRYGRATPQDFWWVQSEKSVTVVELNRTPAGLIIVGKAGRLLLAEEVLIEEVAGGREDQPARQVHDFLTQRFQQERQDALRLRCAETNAFALGMTRQFRFGFSNALVVAGGGAAAGGPPDGYHIRRAERVDAKQVARLHEETLGQTVGSRDLDAWWHGADARVFIAEREKYPVGFGLAQARDGVGRWTAGVREAHRRKGLGRALAHQAMQFFHARHAVPVTTYWATDAPAARFMQAIGAKTERTYLYFERLL